MASALKELGIDRWSLDDQLSLAHELWDNIAMHGAETPLPEELRDELDRRVADLDANPDDVDTWDAIKDYVRRKR